MHTSRKKQTNAHRVKILPVLALRAAAEAAVAVADVHGAGTRYSCDSCANLSR